MTPPSLRTIRFSMCLAVVRVSDIRQCQAAQLFLAVPEHVLQRGVGRQVTPVAVGRADTDDRMLEDAAPARLARPQRLLGPLALGNIYDHRGEEGRGISCCRHAEQTSVTPDYVTVAPAVPLLETDRLLFSVQEPRVNRPGQFPLIFEAEIHCGHLPELALLIAEHALACRIDGKQPTILPNHGDTGRRVLENLAPAFLAGAQLLFGPLLLRDIRHDRSGQIGTSFGVRNARNSRIQPLHAAILAPISLRDVIVLALSAPQ